MTSPARLALLLFPALLSSGCLTLMGGEERAGAEAARQAEAEMGLVEDPALEAYVHEIGERLVVHAARKDVTWRFKIVDMPEPNAFALPGGYVYVSRGLLALVNSEDELAGVVGHEIGHVTGHHSNRRVTLSAPFAIVSGLTGWVTGLVSPSLGEAVSGAGDALAQGLVIAPYGRKQEREADRVGAELAAKAGWNPAALGDFLETLGRDETLATGTERRTAGWFDTHPASPERAADARERAGKLEQAESNPIARDQAELFERLDGLVLGPDPAHGVMLDDRFVHPELGFTIAFPSGWAVSNTPSAVAGQETGGEAAVVLQIVAGVETIEEILAKLQEEGAELDVARSNVAGLPRAHTQVVQGRYSLDVTWIEHRDVVYQITGITNPKQLETWRAAFGQTIDSFRSAEPSELARVRDQRLRISRARSGETLEALLIRVGSFWTPPRAAVSNGIEVDQGLEAESLVKVGQDEPYQSRH